MTSFKSCLISYTLNGLCSPAPGPWIPPGKVLEQGCISSPGHLPGTREQTWISRIEDGRLLSEPPGKLSGSKCPSACSHLSIPTMIAALKATSTQRYAFNFWSSTDYAVNHSRLLTGELNVSSDHTFITGSSACLARRECSSGFLHLHPQPPHPLSTTLLCVLTLPSSSDAVHASLFRLKSCLHPNPRILC